MYFVAVGMPLTVTAWPYTPDPRGTHFSIEGYAFGMVPPWKFLVSTTEALPPYDDLNSGVLFRTVESIPGRTEYLAEDDVYKISKTGTIEPDEVFGITVQWDLLFDRPGQFRYGGVFRELFPPGIQIVGPIQMSSQPVGGTHIPNHVEMLPRKWNFEL